MRGPAPVKCIVWDLDETIWSGVLLEGPVVPNEAILAAIRTLDERGVLAVVASRNDRPLAEAKLEQLGLADRFVMAEIDWTPKSLAVTRVLDALGLDAGATAFVDDDPFERDEVSAAHPGIRCLHPDELLASMSDEAFNPPVVAMNGESRRELLAADRLRRTAEETHQGAPQAFLDSLGLRMEVWRGGPADLDRCAELTVRTNQLNTTGRTFSRAELERLDESVDHRLYVCALEDKYGGYGTIGLALIRIDGSEWTVRLLLMSCRVLSRSVGGAFLGVLFDLATREGSTRLAVELVKTDRNRPMRIMLAASGFELDRSDDGTLIYRSQVPPPTARHVRVEHRRDPT